MNTLRRFADTVRFRGRGLTVDRAVSTGHNRIIRGGALMLFTCYFVPACRQTAFMPFVAWFWMSFRAREAQSEAKGAVLPCKTCVRRSHATLFPDKTMSSQFGEGKKRWEWFHQPCGRVRIVSLVCLEMMSFTLHILSGWLLRPLSVSVNISVLGVVCFQSMEAIVHRMCLRDCSAETTRGFAMAAIGLFHVEVVMS